MAKVQEWIHARLNSDLATLPRLQILHIKLRYGDPSQVKPISYPLSEGMRRERETIVQVKRQHCPDLCDVWMHPEHAWTYVKDDGVWAPQRRIVVAPM